MAAVPIANNDAAYYTDIITDLVVTTCSTPAHLLANYLDIDGGSITSSLVSNPTSGTIIAFKTYYHRRNVAYSSGVGSQCQTFTHNTAGRVIRQQVRTTPGYNQTATVFTESLLEYSLGGELTSITDGRGNI